MQQPMHDANPSRHEQLEDLSESAVGVHEADVESCWEAGPAVGLIVLLQVGLRP